MHSKKKEVGLASECVMCVGKRARERERERWVTVHQPLEHLSVSFGSKRRQRERTSTPNKIHSAGLSLTNSFSYASWLSCETRDNRFQGSKQERPAQREIFSCIATVKMLKFSFQTLRIIKQLYISNQVKL
jgi:hypothetical protein